MMLLQVALAAATGGVVPAIVVEVVAMSCFLAGEFSWCIGAGRMFISEAVAQVQ